jgi:hypothetical protein
VEPQSHEIGVSSKVTNNAVQPNITQSKDPCSLLKSLLPCQADADLILSNTNAQDLHGSMWPGTEAAASTRIDIASLKQSSALELARTLMTLAISMQQLPPNFDDKRLTMRPSLPSRLSLYLTHVTDLVTSKDDLACTQVGVECLLLQSFFYINDGNLRRAWLTARRTLYIAQFLGLQKRYLGFAQNPDNTIDTDRAAAMMWVKAVMVDRYVSPILGLPCAVGRDCFGDIPPSLPITSNYDVLERKLCLIAGTLADQIQSRSQHHYTSTIGVDESLEDLAQNSDPSTVMIPPIWVSNFSPAAQNASIKLLLLQSWFYTLKLLLHIPWMLRALTQEKYAYSRVACREASQAILVRYLALRRAENTQTTVRVIDFMVVLASIALTIDQTKPSLTPGACAEAAILHDALRAMREVSKGRGEFMARQGVGVLEALLHLDAVGQHGEAEKVLYITVPFFGEMVVRRRRPSMTGATDVCATDGSLPTGSNLDILPSAEQDRVNSTWFPGLDEWTFDDLPAVDGNFGLWNVATEWN